MIDITPSWDLPKLDAYIGATLRRMADNRDVMSDEHGDPYYAVFAAGTGLGGTLLIDLEADLSGIGMPMNSPLTVTMDPQAGPIRWLLDDTLIAVTARNLTPEEAGDLLGMDQLLTAFGQWLRGRKLRLGPRLGL